jgi:general stress protein 26
MSAHKLAVVATVSAAGTPQAAVMGIAVTPDLEIIFDTLRTTRKYQNLKANPHVALVFGGEGEVTAQYEGTAEEPTSDELERCREQYFSVWPDGRDRLSWPGMTHIRIRPRWIRYSNFNEGSREIAEMEFPASESPSASL